jgi:hypothetical protein
MIDAYGAMFTNHAMKDGIKLMYMDGDDCGDEKSKPLGYAYRLAMEASYEDSKESKKQRERRIEYEKEISDYMDWLRSED